MSSPVRPNMTPEDREAMMELLAERALQGLSDAESARLRTLLDAAGVEEDDSFDLAAASAALAMLPEIERAPASVFTRAAQAGEMFTRERLNSTNVMGAPALRIVEAEAGVEPVRRMSSAWLGWMAAAACLAFAAIGWLQMFANRQQAVPAQVSIVALRDSINRSPDAKRLNWGDWDKPEISGVKGEVVWSESAQKGYMTFRGLPANDPSKEQYQLWIVDARGLDQRVSGGIFNSDGQTNGWPGEVRAERVGDELIVEIRPGVRVGPPGLFAITIEKPGGTWVSDMKRRVVVAATKS